MVAAGDAAAKGAVYDVAEVQPHNAADIVAAGDAADAAGTGEGAACDGATVVVADDAADIAVAFDAAGDGEVLHGAASAGKAKEALILSPAVGGIDVEVFDLVPIAVEGASV